MKRSILPIAFIYFVAIFLLSGCGKSDDATDSQTKSKSSRTIDNNSPEAKTAPAAPSNSSLPAVGGKR